jgi:monovalent cation:H+ antiporter, CPA1 family
MEGTANWRSLFCVVRGVALADAEWIGSHSVGHIELFVVLLVAAAVVAVVARLVRLPYTLALLLLGLGLSSIPWIATPVLSSDIILLLFLPPLLFEAAFVLDLRRLWDVRAGVLTLAVPGVLLAMAVGGALVHWALDLPWAVALLFGAMIAATDPVAVLATFRHLGVDKRLEVLIEGESLLNDGIALVLLVVLVEAVEGEFRFAPAATSLLLSVVGGVAIGLGIGWIGHRLIASVDDHLTEMTVSVAVAYGAFLSADSLHLSGVLATIAAAMTLGYLGRTRGWIYSEGSERLLIDLWAFLSFVANAGLFLLMGLTVRTVGLREHPGAVVVGIIAALVGRAAVAYGMGFVLDRSGFPLGLADRNVLFWGGLRGAVALAAALSLPVGFPFRAELLAMTYGAVLFTLLVQGLTIAPLVSLLGLTKNARTPGPTSADERSYSLAE